MKMQLKSMLLLVAGLFLILTGCQKSDGFVSSSTQKNSSTVNNAAAERPPFNLEVVLRGEATGFGLIKFRQDNDAEKIINLDTWVRDLEPNHEYLLQRAVDAINDIDGNCTSTSWLTLGFGLTAHSIHTDENGTANEALWRNVAAVPSGSAFDIHFRVVDASNMNVVLTSECYKYLVR